MLKVGMINMSIHSKEPLEYHLNHGMEIFWEINTYWIKREWVGK